MRDWRKVEIETGDTVVYGSVRGETTMGVVKRITPRGTVMVRVVGSSGYRERILTSASPTLVVVGKGADVASFLR